MEFNTIRDNCKAMNGDRVPMMFFNAVIDDLTKKEFSTGSFKRGYHAM